jgi:hypothetical protein
MPEIRESVKPLCTVDYKEYEVRLSKAEGRPYYPTLMIVVVHLLKGADQEQL